MEINLREIRESFVATSRELLQKSESLLLEMEKNADAHHYVELLRAIHTIKGNAGIFELTHVIDICHALETRLEEIRTTGNNLEPAFIDVGLIALDRMQMLIHSMDDAAKQAQVDVRGVLGALQSHKAYGSVSPTAAHDLPGVSEERAPAQQPNGEAGNHVQNNGLEWIKNKSKKIRLPEKYLDLAKKRNSYLTFVVLDLGAQGNLTIAQFYEKLQTLHKAQSLLSFGILRKDTKLIDQAPVFLPYFIILNTQSPINSLFENLGLEIILYHYFWQPAASPGTAGFNETVDSARGDLSPELHTKETHLKVHLDLLNNLIDITGEIVLTRNALVRKVEQSADQSLGAFAKKLSQLVTDLQDKVMKTRLQALGILFQRFPRLVRETALQTGKQAELHIEGGDIEIDKAIIDEISDPLVHILRNAVDHGLEPAGERGKAGKSEKGNIRLKAEMREGNIVIDVSDDGRGLDLEQIKNTALSKGLITRETAVSATPQEIAEYLFLPGFSTKNEVTTISGRGVGMDVVRTNISRIGGSVEISGVQGKGSTVTMVIPQTLSIITCLVVEVDGARFVIPQQNIAEVVTIEPARLKNIQNKEAYELRSRLLPLISTAELLEIDAKSSSDGVVVVVRTEKYHYGLKVQRVLDTEEVVVKTLPQFGQDKQIFSGAAIMGDGQIALILDATLIPRQANLQSNMETRATLQKNRQLAQMAVQYLLFRSYGKKLAFKVTSLPRLEAISPEDIETVVDRKVVHYRKEVIPILQTDFLRSAGAEEERPRNLIILQSENRKYGLLAAEILDIIEGQIELRREAQDRREIEGYTIIDDETVIILNISELLQGSSAMAEKSTAERELAGVAQ